MGYPVRWEEMVVPQLQEETLRTDEASSRPVARLLPLILAAFMATIVLALTALALWTLFQREQDPPALHAERMPNSGHVGLAASSSTRRLGFVTVSGEVVNRMNMPLKNVVAVTELLDTNHRTIKVESGLVVLDPLPSGRTSPFQVELTDDPRAMGYHVYFKQLLGAPFD